MMSSVFEKKETSSFSRKKLLIKINSYYQKSKSGKNKDIDFLDQVCNDPVLQKDEGYIRLLSDSETSRLLYSYRNSVSFLAIKVGDEYKVLSETYSKTINYFDLVAYELGLCYEIFMSEMEKVDDPNLSEELYEEAKLIRKFLDIKEKSLLF